MRHAVVVLAFALVGCGGGGDGGTKSIAAAPCVPVQVTVQLFGDSTMAGYDGANSGSLVVHTPAIGLQAALDARFGRGNTLVTSRAVPGTTSEEFIAGTDTMNAPWPQSVAARIVVVNHGINDMMHSGDVRPYKERLRTLAKTSPALLVFETPNKVVGRDVEAWAQAMREVAAEFHVPLADSYAFSTEDLLGDWAHPTDAGYVAIVAGSLAPAVMAVVAPLRCE